LPVVDEQPGKTLRCPFCRTTFVLPLNRRVAESGDVGEPDS